MRSVLVVVQRTALETSRSTPLARRVPPLRVPRRRVAHSKGSRACSCNVTHCQRVGSSRFERVPKAPVPESPRPPNGAGTSSFTVWSLQWTVPAWSRTPTVRARPRDPACTPATRPYGVSLASSTASSSLRKVATAATGPKICRQGNVWCAGGLRVVGPTQGGRAAPPVTRAVPPAHWRSYPVAGGGTRRRRSPPGPCAVRGVWCGAISRRPPSRTIV